MRNTILRAALVLSGFLLGPAPCPAELMNSDSGFLLDLPEGYGLQGPASGGRYQFVDSTGQAFLSLIRYDGARFASAKAVLDEAAKTLSAKTEGDALRFQGRDAWYGKIAFMQSGKMEQGYAFAMDGKKGEGDYLLISYADSERAPDYKDFLVSAIDSFSPDYAGLRQPGPASWSAFPPDGKKEGQGSLSYGGARLSYPAAPGEAAALQAFIEGEARVLAAYGDEPELWAPAWQRYYRMVYRDSYHRLDALAFVLGIKIEAGGAAGARLTDRQYVEAVLGWVQGFAFTRQGTDSDLMNPLDCAAKADGDCDARALLMAILLQHWNVGAGMAVSYEYSHALALVDIPGSAGFNAGILAGKKRYLVAETTAKVKPGLIAEEQSDPAKWIGIDFEF